MINFRVTSWNTAKRLKQIEFQIEFLRKHDADIVALQEIIPSTETIFRDRLKDKYPYQVSSFELAPNQSLLKKKRMFPQQKLRRSNSPKIVWMKVAPGIIDIVAKNHQIFEGVFPLGRDKQ